MHLDDLEPHERMRCLELIALELIEREEKNPLEG